MKIQAVSAYAAYSCQNIPPHQKQTSADVTANFSASRKNFSDTVAISQTAQNYLAAQSNPGAASGNTTTASFDTGQGRITLDVDAYFSPSVNTPGTAPLLQTLPLLFPTKNNINELSKHISAIFPQFLAENNIPSAPSSITYDNKGEIQLPPDYAYASELKQALAGNPTMSKELSTLNALSSHYVAMQKSLAFQHEYAATTTNEEANAVVARYSFLFSGNKHYETIALQFSESGHLSLTCDDKPLT